MTWPPIRLSIRFILVSIFSLLIILTGFSTPVFAETLNYHLPRFEQSDDPPMVLGPAGEHFTFLRTGSNTNGLFTVAKAIIPPGAGPIPHVHTLTDEWFYFPKGGITIFCDPNQAYTSLQKIPNTPGNSGANAQTVVTKDNSLYYGPHYYLHGFYNNTNENLEVVFIWAAKPGERQNPAADISGYFLSVGDRVGSFKPGMQPTDQEKVAFVVDAPKWGINQSSSFMQYLTSINPAPRQSHFLHENDQVKRLESLRRTPLSKNNAH